MDSNRKQTEAVADTPPVPGVREHGVFGYTAEAVGGFGAGYEAQVSHGANGDSPGERSDSELDSASPEPSSTSQSLEQLVRKSLARAHIDAADVRVTVSGSEVRLHGTVHRSSEKAELETRARSVPGVQSVINELSAQRSDWEGDR